MDRHRIDGPFAVVTLRLAAARGLLRVVATLHLLSLVPVWLSDVGWPVAAALSVALLVALRRALRRLDPAAPHALRILQLGPDGGWRLTFADGGEATAVLVHAVHGESGWCLLRFRLGDGSERTELVHAGRCDGHALRRLRVRLRLDPSAAPGAAALPAREQ